MQGNGRSTSPRPLSRENLKIIDKIVDGQIQKFYKDSCLMSQPYIREPKKSIAEITTEAIAKIGENIQIKRFTRFQIGE